MSDQNTSIPNTTTAPAPMLDASAPAANVATTNTSSVTPDWTTGFNDEQKNYVQTKGFKDTASIVDSYKNLEKLIGAPKERILKLPENMDDAAQVAELYNKLGRPLTPDEYKIETAEGANPESAKWTKELFHKHNITAKQAHGLVQDMNAYSQQEKKAQAEKSALEVKAQEEGLKKEWGNAYEQNTQMAKAAAQRFGVKPEFVDKMEAALGFSELMKFFHTVGSKMGEATFERGQGQNFGGIMTPDQTQAKIKSHGPQLLEQIQKGVPGTKDEYDKLHVMAYPDQTQN